MKIGIITFHRAKNMGAMLQAYALQSVLNERIGNCEIIDYRNEDLEDNYRLKKVSEVAGLKAKIKLLIMRRKNINFENVRNDFISKYLKLSKTIYNKENISLSNSEYNQFVTGSDQVWNTKLNYDDMNYFLNFVDDNKKKNSYAASIGTSELSRDLKSLIRNQLKNFNNISVREIEGKKILDSILPNKDVKVVLDPTLLLTIDKWDAITDESIKNKGNYIFVYVVADTPYLISFARKLAKNNNCKIVYFSNGYKKYPGVINLNKLSPNEFLGYIKYAKYVLTSSFHGFCFSVLYNKDFYYELDMRKNNNNSRLNTLASLLNLKDRELIDGSAKNYDMIDYDSVEILLNKLREESYKYIDLLKE